MRLLDLDLLNGLLWKLLLVSCEGWAWHDATVS